MSFISPRRHMGSYQAVDTVSRVEGASPHQLVVILFDELLLRLDAAIRHAQRGEAVPTEPLYLRRPDIHGKPASAMAGGQ